MRLLRKPARRKKGFRYRKISARSRIAKIKYISYNRYSKKVLIGIFHFLCNYCSLETEETFCNFNLYQAGLFELLRGGGSFLAASEKLLYKLFTSLKSLETWYNTYLDFNKNFNISHVIKMMTSALFLMT